MKRQLSPACAERLLAAAGLDVATAAITPLMLLAPDGSAVLWANRAATNLFGTESADRLQAQLVRPGDRGSAGFMSRMARIRIGDEPYLERMTLPDGLGLRAVFSVSAVSDTSRTFVLFRGSAPIGAPRAASFSFVSALADEGSPPDPQPSYEAAAASPRVETRLSRREHALRFLWEARADGTLTGCDRRLPGVLGVDALRIGDNIADRLTKVDAIVGATVAHALAESRNISGLHFDWPGAGEASSFPVDLGFARRPNHPVEIRGFLKVYSDRPFAVGTEDGGEHPERIAPRDKDETAPPLLLTLEPAAEEGHRAPSVLPDESGPDETATSDTAPPSIDRNVDRSAGDLGREVPATAFGNIVHFRSFKGATIHAAFGESLSPTKPAWLKVPDAAPLSPPLQDASFESPVWAESPAATETGILSPDERTAFAEIGRTLGAGPIASASDTSPASSVEELSEDATDAPSGGVDAGEIPHAHQRDDRTAPDQNVLDALPVGIAIRQEGRLIFLNRTLLDWLGLANLAEAGTRGAGSPPDHVPEAAPGSGGPFETLETLIGNHGRTVTVESRTAPVIWNGRDAVLTTLLPAATVHPPATPETAPDNGIGVALEMVCDGVAFLDARGLLQSLSPKAEQLFGVTGDALAGDSAAVLFMAEEEPAWTTLLGSLPSDGEASARGFLQARTESGPVPARITLVRLGFESIGLLVWNDIERLQTETTLIRERGDADRANALKSEFLAKVSHEIRTPLNAILGFAEVIMEERFGPIGTPRYLEYLRDIHASGTHVMSLVNDLLDLSRIEAGRLELQLGPVDVNALIGECVGTLQPQAHRERVIVRSSLAPRLPLAQADERTFRQIILNLLSNAVKFNEPGGQVIVSTAAQDSRGIVIRIRDTGIGMSDSEIEIAMEPFRQLATAKVPGGTGLGLPLTKALVEASRATMTIKSRVGEGTLVEMVFPASGSEPLSIPAE